MAREEEEFDPFKLSSGLPLADNDVKITGLEFGYDAQYMNGEACVAIVTMEDEEGTEHRQLYSVGKMFEPADRGDRLVHTSGKKVNLNEQSNYGRFVNALMHMDNADEFMAAVRESDHEPVFSAAWLVGYNLHMTAVKVTVQDGKEKSVILPSHFNGVEDAPKAKSGAKGGSKLAPKPAAATTKAKPKAAADDDGDYGIDDDDVREALIEAAKEAADFEAYSEAALDVDGVMANKAYQKAALSSKPGSIWATFGGE